MTEKHIGKVVQVTGPVLDIRFREGELPALLNAIEIDVNGHRLVAEVAQQVGDGCSALYCHEFYGRTGARCRCSRYGKCDYRSRRR